MRKRLHEVCVTTNAVFTVASVLMVIAVVRPGLRSQTESPLRARTQTLVRSASQSESIKRCAKKAQVYFNKQYGLHLCLPDSWKGYTVLTQRWEGHAISDQEQNKSSQLEAGPEILIRHPLWTNDAPRQDIPIMIFTKAQWELVQGEKIAVSVAPTRPCELAHNSQYVFALRPRFDFGPEKGQEEVRQILTAFSQGKTCW